MGETLGPPKPIGSGIFVYKLESKSPEDHPKEEQQHIVRVVYERIASWFTGQREKTDDTNLIS